MHLLKLFRVMLVAGTLAASSVAVTATGVLAYGHADEPLAQIEYSGNCNNPDFPLCAAPPNGFGLGGIWLWIEIDAEGTADVAGAGCGHVRGVGGGAGPIRGEFDWWWSATPQGGDASFGTYSGADGYYNVALGPDVLSFPVTVGHYSVHPAPAVAIELQVAP